jgi:hypothetical protein
MTARQRIEGEIAMLQQWKADCLAKTKAELALLDQRIQQAVARGETVSPTLRSSRAASIGAKNAGISRSVGERVSALQAQLQSLQPEVVVTSAPPPVVTTAPPDEDIPWSAGPAPTTTTVIDDDMVVEDEAEPEDEEPRGDNTMFWIVGGVVAAAVVGGGIYLATRS